MELATWNLVAHVRKPGARQNSAVDGLGVERVRATWPGYDIVGEVDQRYRESHAGGLPLSRDSLPRRIG